MASGILVAAMTETALRRDWRGRGGGGGGVMR